MDNKTTNASTSKHEQIMKKGIDQAEWTMKAGHGGPFGAVITDAKDNIIAVASNTVLKDHDPTAHAEVNAIRLACKALGTHDLSGYTLYATGYPCPMCLSAIMWANIKTVYYGCTAKDADAIGFRDEFIYDFIKDNCQNEKVLKLEPVGRSACMELFEEYHSTNKEMY